MVKKKGRFLKWNSWTQGWEEVPDAVARVKVAQALKYRHRCRRLGITSSPAGSPEIPGSFNEPDYAEEEGDEEETCSFEDEFDPAELASTTATSATVVLTKAVSPDGPLKSSLNELKPSCRELLSSVSVVEDLVRRFSEPEECQDDYVYSLSNIGDDALVADALPPPDCVKRVGSYHRESNMLRQSFLKHESAVVEESPLSSRPHLDLQLRTEDSLRVALQQPQAVYNGDLHRSRSRSVDSAWLSPVLSKHFIADEEDVDQAATATVTFFAL